MWHKELFVGGKLSALYFWNAEDVLEARGFKPGENLAVGMFALVWMLVLVIKPSALARGIVLLIAHMRIEKGQLVGRHAKQEPF